MVDCFIAAEGTFIQSLSPFKGMSESNGLLPPILDSYPTLVHDVGSVIGVFNYFCLVEEC